MKNKYTKTIKELSDKELLYSFGLTQILLFMISLVLGLFLTDHLSDFLGLFDWQDKNILLIGGGAGLALVILDLLLTKLLPPHYYDDGGLNERIFQNRNIGQIAIIAAMVAFSEEILFRGILQTNFGLFFSSILFAIIHYRYLFNWFLFTSIVILSFFIGILFEYTGNLSVTIFMHFLIDFLLGVVIRLKHNKIQRTGRGCSVHE